MSLPCIFVGYLPRVHLELNLRPSLLGRPREASGGEFRVVTSRCVILLLGAFSTCHLESLIMGYGLSGVVRSHPAPLIIRFFRQEYATCSLDQGTATRWGARCPSVLRFMVFWRIGGWQAWNSGFARAIRVVWLKSFYFRPVLYAWLRFLGPLTLLAVFLLNLARFTSGYPQ